jgi:hypothetical protein
VGGMCWEVEEMYLVDLAEPHEVNRYMGAMAVKKEESMAAAR